MPRVLLILALVATAFWVFTIVDCAVQPPARHRGVSKPVWILIVVLLPVLGGLLWFAVGRMRAATIAARRAPDDDPEFLGRLGSTSEQDERIRRLEEELAQLDSEDDDPRWNFPRPQGDHTADSADASTTNGPAGATEAPSGAGDASDAPRTSPRSADDDDTRGQRGAAR
ncbi:PLDc N-terminal domain-containing protein [Microbacterium sp. C7(2022)]|uniref:PLDc N-terminal domain-containing protein n=1 Tax=Microbacterium sp. C7(2022) TaxID=2992759 RepID=UPI00237C1779|nr:PLDc N-terminal domain-containing protein [Microbacterium sp. C7(2022)]MDE0546153.1 PLDc N-terminal domain-containing protein [Microbacterium sp. C7(2022)]